MFVGHLAVGLAAKTVEPRVPLAAWLAASFGLDMIWPLFVLTGLEIVRVDPGNTAFTPLDFQSYPWSHSLAMSLLWGGIAGVIAVAMGARARAGWIIGAVVVSHWVLDFVTHRADLALWPGGPFAGLGLWNSIPATIAVEGALFAAGIVLYLRATTARDGVGRWAFWALVGVTGAIWISGPLSPPPPSATAIGVVGLAGAALFTLWAAWIERHRELR